MKYALFVIIFTLNSFAMEGDELIDIKIISEYRNLNYGNNKIGVLIAIKKDWHIYWKNPGDAGLPTEIIWKIPENIQISKPKMPTPKKFSFSDMASYGFDNETMFIYDLFIPKDYAKNDLNLEIDLNGLICKEKCLPVNEKSAALFKIGNDKSLSKFSKYFDKYEKKIPAKNSNFNLSAKQKDEFIYITINNIDKNDEIEIFPYESTIFKTGYNQNPEYENNKYKLTMKLDEYRINEPNKIIGLLVIKNNEKTKSFEINVPINN